jgi:hypothetical protein
MTWRRIRSGIPAAMRLDLRLGELAVHSWDLARAIGADETLDPEVVAALWAFADAATQRAYRSVRLTAHSRSSARAHRSGRSHSG